MESKVGDRSDGPRVYCAECGEQWTTPNETVEDRWTCQECRGVSVGIQFLDWIKEKIRQTLTEQDDRHRFVFRELVQNADDVGAKVLVARFKKDALLVANDGEAFSTDEGGHFERLANVLGRRQEDDPDTTGSFGTGFQTVYSITNFPEVHSNGWSLQIDPTISDEAARAKDARSEAEGLSSPYAPRGVLFRFPWRDTRAAKKQYGDAGRCFEDRNYWPRWNKRARRSLYDDLTGYVHDLLLCCRSLRCIRLIWEDGPDEREAFQALRDFDCPPSEVLEDQFPPVDGSVEQGPGHGTWQLGEWHPEGEQSEFRYVVGHTLARDDSGQFLWVVRGRSRKLRILHQRENPTGTEKGLGVVKHSDVWVLLPLFPARNLDVRERFVYSVLPLTKRGGNQFVTSAHLFPEENRKDIDISGNEGESGRWYEFVRDNAIRLYLEVFPTFLEEIRRSGLSNSDQQEAILDALPAPMIDLWMKPELETGPSPELDEMTRSTVSTLLTYEILYVNDNWVSPLSAYWAVTEEGARILGRLSIPFFTDGLTNHERFRSTLESLVENRILDFEKFHGLWDAWPDSVMARYGKTPRQLVYGQALGSSTLDYDFVSDLLQFCILRQDASKRFEELPIVPDFDGVLRRIGAFRKPPPGYEELEDLLPDTMRVHPEFRNLLDNRLSPSERADNFLKGATERHEELSGKREAIQSLFQYLDICESEFGHAVPKAGDIRAAGYRFIPDFQGELRTPKGVRIAPPEYVERTMELFRMAESEVPWGDEEIITNYAPLLVDLGCRRPDYLDLVQRLDWDSDELSAVDNQILLEGMLTRYGDEELVEERFIYAGDEMRKPSRVFLGTTDDEVLDRFIGVIDVELQSFIDEEELEGDLAALGVRTVSPNTFVERIEDTIWEEEDRFERLDPDDWEALTRGLGYLVREDFRPPPDVVNRRILPIKYHGKMTVDHPPPNPGSDSHRGENYGRDWVFAPPEGDVSGLTKRLRRKIRFLNLHPDAGVDVGGVKDMFSLVGLQEGRSPTNFVRHFLADYRGTKSLFRDEGLVVFLGETDSGKLNQEKRRMLGAVREYFTSPHTEPGLKPTDMGEIPLLYDASGRWRSAKEFVQEELDAELEFLGMSTLHPDFSDWSKESKAALGVRDSADPSVVVSQIERFVEAGDRTALANTLLYILTSEMPISDAFGLLKGVRWIPTLDKALHRPSTVLIQTSSNKEIVGEEYNFFIDFSSAEEEFRRSAVERPEGDRERYVRRGTRLGMAESPDLGEMLQLVRRLRDSDEEPPPKLFPKISGILSNNPEAADGEDWSDLAYYSRGRWVSANRIYLTELPFLPPEIRDELEVRPPADRWAYLKAIGARDECTVEDLLVWLAQAPLDSHNLWRELTERRAEIEDAHVEEFGNQELAFPPLEVRLVPKSCTLDDEVPSMVLDSVQILGIRGISEESVSTLERLGSRSLPGLNQTELMSLADDLPANERGGRVLRKVLGILAGAGYDGSPSPTVLCTLNGALRRTRLDQAIFPDHPASRVFKDSIPMVDLRCIPQGSEFLSWALGNGLRTLSSRLEVNPVGWDWGDGRIDESQRLRFEEIQKVLSSRWPEGPASTESPFGWMSTCEIRRLPQVRVELAADGQRKVAHLAMLPRMVEGEVVEVYLPERGPQSFYREIAASILTTSSEGGTETFSGYEDEGDVEDLVHKLLLYPLDDWQTVVPGYRYEGDTLPIDLLEVVEDWGEAYYEIRENLATWYQGCQICGRRTPRGEGFHETLETVTSVISRVGGRYHGRRETSVRNSLWLCPNHQTLFKRGLVRILLLEGAYLNKIQKLSVNVNEKDDDDLLPIEFCEVKTGRFGEDGKVKEEIERRMLFRVAHLSGMLDWFEEHLTLREGP